MERLKRVWRYVWKVMRGIESRIYEESFKNYVVGFN